MDSPRTLWTFVITSLALFMVVLDNLVVSTALPVIRTDLDASLEELGALADPPMTKDAVAGRIRRLLAMADKRAADLGIPDTEANVTADMLEGAP